MKRFKEVIFIASILLLIVSGMAYGAISISVNPECAPADTTTGFTFQTQAAEAGGAVQFEMFGDFNGDGEINGDDWSFFSSVVADNITVDGGPLTADTDPSSPDITAVFNPFGSGGGFLPPGDAVMRVRNSLGESATVQFCITPVSAPQAVTGTVYEQGTTTPVPYALVFGEDAATEDTVSVAITDINGSYNLQIPTPGDYKINSSKYGYIEASADIITITDAGVSSHILYLIPSDADITGTATEYGTGNPVGGVGVYAETIDGKSSWTTTDINGNFTLSVLSGMEWKVEAERTGYISSPPVVITPPANYNIVLFLIDADITGTVTEYGTGNPVWGVEVHAETIDGKNSRTTTDINGNFTLSVLSGMEWKVDSYIDITGYFDVLIPSNNYEDDIIIIPTVSGPNIVDFAAYKETAWIEGTVLDEYGIQLVEGALFYAQKDSAPEFWRLGAGHYTDSSGQVAVGVMAGDWRVGLCMNCHEQPVRVGGVEREMVPPPDETISNLLTGEHREVTLHAYYADGAIEGRVFREDCVTPAPSEVRVMAWTDNALNGSPPASVGHINTQTETDENGFYRLPLLGGTWTVRAEMFDWNKQSGEQAVALTTDGNDEIDQPGETITGIDLCLDLAINVSDQVTGTRRLPAYAAPGGDITVNIVIDVDENKAPSGLIVNEYIPSGWTPGSASPAYKSYDPVLGKISWLFGVGNPVEDTTITFNARVPDTEIPGTVRNFNGELLYNDPDGNPVTVQAGGDQDVTIGYPFSSYDTNEDWIIGDFELLDAIDDWAGGNLGDFDLLDLIDYWAEGSYCWDTTAERHKTGAHDEYGACL